MTCREAILLRVTADSGLLGLGEASPHPALPPSALRVIGEQAEDLATRLHGAEVESIDPLSLGLSPALACALDIALCDLLAQERGISVTAFLGDREPPPSVPVNATIAAAATEDAVIQARGAVQKGFRCLKLKVGGSEAADDVERVAAVRKAVGLETKLRLDANGAWSVGEAIKAIHALAPQDIEYIEQPVPAGDLSGLARVRAAVGVPIAADESITDLESAKAVLEAEAADILVIKPMVAGGLRPGRRIIEMAMRAGKRCVVTTTIDSSIGTAAALHLAATLPDPPLACGLATTQLLSGDLVRTPLEIESGWMKVPAFAGLGVALDKEALANFRIDLNASHYA